MVIGLDQPPGKYTLRVTVTDRISKDRKELSRNFEVLKRGFGIVRLTAPCVGFTGQSFMAHFGVVGFRKGTDKVPKVSVRMNILDENSKATLTKPFTVEIPKDLPEEAKAEDLTVLPMQFPFPLNRPGTFTIQLEATDQISKETVKQSYKITVLDPKKYETGK